MVSNNALKWPDELTIDLIYKVKEHENLWNSLNPDKKKRNKRNDSWKKIAKKVGNGRTSEDCQKKWASLCQSYRSYRRGRRTKSRAGAKDMPKITWFAYDTMHSFMNDIYKPQNSNDVGDLNESFDGNVDMEGIQEMDSEDVSTHDSVQSSDRDESQGNCGEGVTSHQQVQGNSTLSMQKDGRLPKLFKSPKKISLNKKRMGKEDMMKVAFQYLTKKTSTPKNSALAELVYERKEEDEYDIFGRLLAEKLRHLDDVTREYAMRDINNIMFEAKMYPRSSISHQSHSPHAPSRSHSSTPPSLNFSPHHDVRSSSSFSDPHSPHLNP